MESKSQETLGASMQGEIQAISYATRHDPAAVAGLLLIGCSSVLFIHIQFKMIRAGYKTSYTFLRLNIANGWDTPSQYLRVRAKHSWSPWPAYLLFPCVIVGIALLVFGLFRL
jgi:hypothetical protein